MRDFPLLAQFDPRLDVLPAAQRALWPRLADLPADAVLYGGTAIAVRLAHRASIDFDLFLPRPFDPDDLRRGAPLLRGAEVVQVAPDTLTVRVDGVRLSLFGVTLPDAIKARLRAAVRLVDRVPVVGTRGSSILPGESG